MKKTFSTLLATGLLASMTSAVPALAATPAQEKAFVDGFKRAVDLKDAKALRALLYVKDADPTALEFYNMMMLLTSAQRSNQSRWLTLRPKKTSRWKPTVKTFKASR